MYPKWDIASSDFIKVKSVVKGISLGFLLFAVVLVFSKIQLSRYVLAFSYIASLLLVMIERSVLYHILPLTKGAEGWNQRILIYGAGELGSALFRAIASSPKLGILPIGFVDDRSHVIFMIFVGTINIEILQTCNAVEKTVFQRPEIKHVL